jgi:hypothetical protein
MSRSWFLVVLGLALTAGLSQAENQPVSRPPVVAFVRDLDRSKGLIVITMPEFVPVVEMREVTEEVEVNGKKMVVKKLVSVNVITTVTKDVAWNAEKGTAINRAGKRYSKDELFKQLKAGDKIIVFWAKEIDPMYLKGLKEDVVLLKMQVPTVLAPIPEPVPPTKTPERVPPSKPQAVRKPKLEKFGVVAQGGGASSAGRPQSSWEIRRGRILTNPATSPRPKFAPHIDVALSLRSR